MIKEYRGVGEYSKEANNQFNNEEFHHELPTNPFKDQDTIVNSLYMVRKNLIDKETSEILKPSNARLTHFHLQPKIHKMNNCTVGWDCTIHRLHLCRGVRPSSSECRRYDTKQSDGEVPVMLKFWGMRNIPSLPSLPSPFWPRSGSTW